MVSALSFDCVFCMLFCGYLVLLVKNLIYSLTTFAFVSPLYSYSGQITPIDVLPINQSCIKDMDNSKAQPESIKFLSLNVRGLSNFPKRRAIFSCGILCLNV